MTQTISRAQAKLIHVVVAALPPTRLTWPFIAAWNARSAPTVKASASGNTRCVPPPVTRGPTAMPTPTSASAAEAIRARLTGCTPAGPIPSRSTTIAVVVWPATTQIVTSATPAIGTANAWVVTTSAPNDPPVIIHHGIDRPRSASASLPNAARDRRLPSIRHRPTHPDPVLRIAVTIGSPVIRLRDPLARDWTAITTPPMSISTPARTFSQVARLWSAST